jgi:hypothetical protein
LLRTGAYVTAHVGDNTNAGQLRHSPNKIIEHVNGTGNLAAASKGKPSDQPSNSGTSDGETASPALRGNAYHPDSVGARSADVWQPWAEKVKAAEADALAHEAQSQVNKTSKKGSAPGEIKRIDGPDSSVTASQWHAHGANGGAINMNGTIHDRDPKFSKDTLKWLRLFGWDIPIP